MISNLGRKQDIFKGFGKKGTNKGMLWASLAGLGVSAAIYGMRKNGNKDVKQPLQHVMENFRTQSPNQMAIASAIAEFSKELTPDKNLNKNK